MTVKPTHYFVIRSPYAQLILTGVKTFEFRTNAKTFANKRLAIAVAKSGCDVYDFYSQLSYWSERNKNLKKEAFEEANAAAEALLDKTDGCGKIIGEITTSDVEELDGEMGVRVLSYKLWPESEWIDSPGGLGVRKMP